MTTELSNPHNWTACGGCWTFTDSGIVAQAGIMGLHYLFYNIKRFSDFMLQVRISKLAEGGGYGVLLRFDEKDKQGYIVQLLPGRKII